MGLGKSCVKRGAVGKISHPGVGEPDGALEQGRFPFSGGEDFHISGFFREPAVKDSFTAFSPRHGLNEFSACGHG